MQNETIIFNSFSDFNKKTAGRTIFLRISNGYHIHVTKTMVKRLSNSMAENGDKFTGTIFLPENKTAKSVQVLIK